MKMKYHKIPGVQMEVCTAEQVVAYNIASAHGDIFRRELQEAREKRLFQSVISEWVARSVDFMVKGFQRDYPKTRYNVDAIKSALHAGFLEFIEKPFIATDYKQVGKVFKAYYL